MLRQWLSDLSAWSRGYASTLPSSMRPADWARPLKVEGFRNLYCVSPGVYRGAEPSSEGFARIAEGHPLEVEARPIRTVLSLRALHDDPRIHPMHASVVYEAIRFDTWDIKADYVVKFLRILGTPELLPVYVHCQFGSDRTGAMIAFYRIAMQHWEKRQAVDEMEHGGFGYHWIWWYLSRRILTTDMDAILAQANALGPWQP